MWLSLVERVVRDDEAAGSNPVTPISRFGEGGVQNKPWQGRILRAAFYCFQDFFFCLYRVKYPAASNGA